MHLTTLLTVIEIAATIAFTMAWLAGVRIAFSLPIDLRANWIFRITAVRNPSAIAARSLLVLVILPTARLAVAAVLGVLFEHSMAGRARTREAIQYEGVSICCDLQNSLNQSCRLWSNEKIA